MNTCKTWEKQIENLFAGIITEKENEELQNHLSECAACRGLVKVHTALEKSELITPQVETEEFFRMRQNVLRQIRVKQKKEINMPIVWQNIKSLFAHPALGYAMAAVMLAIIIYNKPLKNSPSFVEKDNLIRSINQVAAQNTRLSDVRNSPYSYRDVSIREQDNGNIQLSFDVTTRVTTEAKPDDPLVQEVLAQSLVNNEPVGARLRVIKYSKKIMDTKIMEALSYTALNDQNSAVRLKAMNALSGAKDTELIREAMLQILQNETSVQMRLLAIDYLTQDPAGQNMLRQNLYESDTPVNPALLIRAGQNKIITNQDKEK